MIINLSKEVIEMNIPGFTAKSVLGAEGRGTLTKFDIKRSKHMRAKLAGPLFLFLAAVASSADALDRTIDDFTTGPYRSPSYRTGVNNTAYANPSSQNGAMLGGNRSTGMYVCAPGSCGLAQPTSYEFKRLTSTTGAFLFNAGFGAGPRIDMAYGWGSTRMNVDFTPYDRIRVTFMGLSQPLNFNIQAFTGTTWAQNGCNVAELNRPFSIDFPFSGFSVSVPASFNWASINYMDFIFQSGSAIGSVDIGISSIVLTNSTTVPTYPVLQECHLN